MPTTKNRTIGQGKDRGRPQSITPEKSAIFLAAIGNGLALKESLLQAGFSDDAYRRLLDKSADFRGQMEAAEMKLKMLAKSELAKKIKGGDAPTIRWYLERKCPEEFGRTSLENGNAWDNNHMTIVLPGDRPHPRITVDPDDPRYKYANEISHPRITPE